MIMSIKTYSDKLKDPRWQKKRLEVFNRDNWCCQLCDGTKSTLNVHHLTYTVKDVWDEPIENLKTLCEDCHLVVETLKQYGKAEALKIHKLSQQENLIAVVHTKEDIYLLVFKKSTVVATYCIGVTEAKNVANFILSL